MMLQQPFADVKAPPSDLSWCWYCVLNVGYVAPVVLKYASSTQTIPTTEQRFGVALRYIKC